jgi:hypothetical protein
MSAVEAFLEYCDLVDESSDDSWTLTWSDARYDGRHISLRVVVETHLDGIPDEVWVIRACNALEINLKSGATWGAALCDNHVLL